MRIAITGSTGFIGSRLITYLRPREHEIFRLIRRSPSDARTEIQWNPAGGMINASALEGMDAVVHLAGENIAAGRWTKERKTKIRDSRVNGTQLLCQALAKMETPPRVLVSASAIGYYGNRGEEILDEQSPPGTGFLADVCREWEAATDPAREKGIRVVNLRIGLVLSTEGGALPKMLLPFRFGLGGIVGSGKQYWSWIAIDDLITAIDHVLTNDSLEGPVNAVAPNPVTNREFTKTLGRILNRPTALPLPGFVAKLALGQMADELLLAGARVTPAKLEQSGYEFLYRDLGQALRHLLTE